MEQECFGLLDTPLLGGPARVPLLLELLSPAGRPLQARATPVHHAALLMFPPVPACSLHNSHVQ